MCGIIAYTGKRQAAKILFDGLKQLEYRGYDSAGIAVQNGQYLSFIKRAGRVDNIADALALQGTCGVGHTRWATHGGAEDKNAHPHTCGKFTVVHNGIIENYAQIKENLSELGHTFCSDTDSETAAHLLSAYYEGDFLQAVKKAVARLKGSFALCITCTDFPNKVVCVRQNSPLIIGRDESGSYAASDIPALGKCKKICVLSDGEIALLTKDNVALFDFSLHPIVVKMTENAVRAVATDKGEFAHYMLKEIYEAPFAVQKTAELFDIESAEKLKGKIKRFSRVYIVGCGTAYHSGVTGALLLEKALKIPVSAELASEFCYRKPLLSKDCLVLAVSQSGETADTLSAGRLAKKKGACLCVITNVSHSTLARLADYCFLTQAGVEVGVAATKTYCAQLSLFYALSAFFSGKSYNFLKKFPAACKKIQDKNSQIQALSERLAKSKTVYFLGRGADYASAVEGSLKLREVSYIAGAGYAAGELKHGSIALMDENAVVVAIITQNALKEKSKNAVNEVRSRGAKVIAVTPFDDIPAEEKILLPALPQKYYPLISQIPLQLLAYYTAVRLGLDPDKPRNLAKSVTVE